MAEAKISFSMGKNKGSLELDTSTIDKAITAIKKEAKPLMMGKIFDNPLKFKGASLK